MPGLAIVKSPAPPGEVLTLAEAAAFLRVSDDGLRHDAQSGSVPCRVVAGEWRFSRSGLLAWLSHPTPAAEPARTGAELVRRIAKIRERSSFPETEEEAEAFLAEIYAARKADPVGR